MVKRLVFLGAVALIGGIAARSLTAPRPAVADPSHAPAPPLGLDLPLGTGTPRLRWEAVWDRPAPDFTGADFAPSGSILAWIDKAGGIRRLDGATGATLWQTAPMRGLNRVTVAPSGRVIAWGYLNPAKPGVRILDATLGDKQAVMLPLDGAVWNVAAVPSASGEQLVIATGESLLYRIPLRSDTRFPPPPVPLPGIGESLDVASSSADQSRLFVGLWQTSGIGVWGGNPSPLWRMQERDARRSFRVHLSNDGMTAVATSGIGPREEGAQLHVWDAQTGQVLWSDTLHGREAVAGVSADGQRIAVTFLRETDDDADGEPDPAPGRKIVLFDRSGRRLFGPKGGSFFNPELLSVSRDGMYCTVRDGQDILTLDNRGRRIARLHLPAPPGKAAPRLQQIVPTRDGSGLLLITGDGRMRLYKARESK